jgi:hypothetical protein
VQRAKENERKINLIHPGTPSNKHLTTLAAYRCAAFEIPSRCSDCDSVLDL